MSSLLTSQGLVLATAMAVSAGTVILFDLFRHRIPIKNQLDSPPQLLKSCLSSESKKREKARRERKRVRFAEDVRDSKKNGEVYRREQSRRWVESNQKINGCGNEIKKMPANRAALYGGILRDRVHRMEYSC